MSLNSRGLIRIANPGGRENVLKFLQGLVTQDMVKSGSKAGGTRAVGSLFLNPKGRILSESIIVFPQNDEKSLWIELPTENVDLISSLLVRHRLRQPFEIEKVVGASIRVVDECIAGGDDDSYEDPRVNCGGGVMPRRMIVQDVGKISNEDAYHIQRIKAGIPEGVSEIPPDTVVPIFYNFDLMNCISFAKGCYTGQELVTRTIRRGIVRRRIFPFKINHSSTMTRDTTPSTSLVYDGKEKLGNVISIHGDWGLAVTQLPNSSVPLNESNQMKDAFTVSDNSKWSLDDGTKVELYLPSYI